MKLSYTNRFPPTQHTRYRSSWGPSSVSAFSHADIPRPSPEEEEFQFYHERLHSAQSRQLIPLQEDLADWINKTISMRNYTSHISWVIHLVVTFARDFSGVEAFLGLFCVIYDEFYH